MNTLLVSLLIMTSAMTNNTFTPRELPYAYDALAPYVSEETLRFHHDKHYAGYVAKLNELLVDSPLAGQPIEDIILASSGPIFNNAAQIWNHEFFFDSLSATPQATPSGKLLEAINSSFGSVDGLKSEMTKACLSLFGSGWVWLAEDKQGGLVVVSEPNAGNPMLRGMKPLLTIDVWEHAYYIDYRNRRADSVAALWSVVDWKVVGERYDRK